MDPPSWITQGAAVGLLMAAAWAQAADSSRLMLNGFGTLGVVHSSEEDADFVGDAFARDGAGATSTWSAEVDSRLGAQLAGQSGRVSGVVQVMVEQRYDGSFDPTLEWANLAFQVTPSLNVRVGRMMVPTSMVSEHRKVGYANPWLRPPPEVYRLTPLSSFDGIEVSYRSQKGPFNNLLQATYGGRNSKVSGGGELEVEDGVTVADTLEWGPASIFVSFSSARLTFDALDPLFDGFRLFGAGGESIADAFAVRGKRVDVMTLGGRYDSGPWFAKGEWVRSESRTVFGDSDGWYATGGYRFGALTPYATAARILTVSDTSHPGLSLAGLPAPLAAQAAGLNGELNRMLGAAPAQKRVAVGARWDFARSAALKVQVDAIDLAGGSPGVLINEQPGFERGGTVTLVSAAVDFVF